MSIPCSNVTCTSTAQMHCSCRLAAYCGKACQRADWRAGHQTFCPCASRPTKTLYQMLGPAHRDVLRKELEAACRDYRSALHKAAQSAEAMKSIAGCNERIDDDRREMEYERFKLMANVVVMTTSGKVLPPRHTAEELDRLEAKLDRYEAENNRQYAEYELAHGMQCAMAAHGQDRLIFTQSMIGLPADYRREAGFHRARFARLEAVATQSMADALELLEEAVDDGRAFTTEYIATDSVVETHKREGAYKVTADHFKTLYESRKRMLAMVFD